MEERIKELNRKDYKKQVEENIKRNSRVEKIDLEELPWSEKLKKLQDLFGGR